MTFEELAIGYAIIDTAFTGGERFRSVYGWFDKTIKAECEAWSSEHAMYLELLKKIPITVTDLVNRIMFSGSRPSF